MDFINSPDSVSFVARGTDYFFEFVRFNSNIVVTQILSGRYVLAYIHRDHYDEISSELGSSFIGAISPLLGTLDHLSLEEAGVISVHNQPNLSLKGSGVLIGFVDTGIDYTQKPFLYEDGTSKIQYIYDQSENGEAPDGFYFGVEYSNEQINKALQSENPHDIVPHRDTIGHGTFLASVASGRKIDNFTGVAPNTEIIAVKLKKACPFYLENHCVPTSQENAFESSSVMVGVEYILKKAKQLNRPVVICIGLGTNFGCHDGFTIFEEYLSAVSNLKGVCLCTAVGNESQEHHHTTGKIKMKNDTQNIDVRVGNNAGNIAIVIMNGVTDKLSVSIRSPSGEMISRISSKPGTVFNSKLILEPTRICVEYYFPVEGSSGQMTIVRLFDTSPGIWRITLHGDIILDGTYHAWLPISGFVSPEVEFLSSSPYYTTTIPSTMYGSISCGAYNSLNKSLYIKSSWGPTRIGSMMPDLVAPGVNIAGYFPTGFGVMSGTSVAASITAGTCALLLEWGIVDGNDSALCTYQIRAYLIRGCQKIKSMEYPNEQWGYGTLNLMESFYLMREM